MDGFLVVDFIENVFFPSTIVIGILLAFVTRYYRANFQKKIKFNKIFAVNQFVNQLIVIPESNTALSVWTIDEKRLFKIEKIGNKWYFQDSVNKKNLITIKNGYFEKFITLNDSYIRNNSPLHTTPSVLKIENKKLKNDINIGTKTDFTFGNTNIFLRWVGLNYLEIITKENDSYLKDSVIVHQRVGISKEYNNGNLNGYLIFFDYDKINIEILITTFLFSLLNQRSRFRGILKKPSKSSKFKDYLKSYIT